MSVQYLSIENCKSRNEIQIFEIYDYYVGVLNNPLTETVGLREFANDTRNEAKEILNSRLEGEELAALQAKFLARFNQFYKIGDIEYSTNFDFFLENQISTVRTQGMILFCSNLEAKRFHTAQQRTTTETEIRLICHTIHKDLICGKYGQGTFVQC